MNRSFLSEQAAATTTAIEVKSLLGCAVDADIDPGEYAFRHQVIEPRQFL
jgi:hypothetical protein